MKRCNSAIDCDHERSLVFKKNGYPILDCGKCHRRFAELTDVENHVKKVYSDNYFFNGNDGYPNYLDEKEILFRYGKYYSGIIKRFTTPGKLLDVGCAAGFIMKGFENSGWDCIGIEPNATMVSFGKNELKLNIFRGDLETFVSVTTFDLITLIQVIGHFYNIDKAMENVACLVKQNGLVLVESWNKDSFFARIMGRNWHEYSPPSVISWFSNKSLKSLFENYGSNY
jgi:SAM-dependent methyltransferase